jgi:hypothetical protein
MVEYFPFAHDVEDARRPIQQATTGLRFTLEGEGHMVLIDVLRPPRIEAQFYAGTLDQYEAAVIAGNRENSQSFSTVAMLTRQSKDLPSSPASFGETAISVVVPCPFFQGMRR